MPVPVAVVRPRVPLRGLRTPPGPRRAVRHASPLPLLAADAASALAGVAAVTVAARAGVLGWRTAAPVAPAAAHAWPDAAHGWPAVWIGWPAVAAVWPAVVLLLTVAALHAHAGLYGRRAAPPVPGAPLALDELPALCARITAGWVVLAALLAGIPPHRGLPLAALLAGCAVHTAVSCAGRAAVYGRRRSRAVRHPHPTLVIGPAATAHRVAAALLRHPACGVHPVGVAVPGGDTGHVEPRVPETLPAAGERTAPDAVPETATATTATATAVVTVAGAATTKASVPAAAAPAASAGTASTVTAAPVSAPAPAPAPAPGVSPVAASATSSVPASAAASGETDLPVLSALPDVQRAVIQNTVRSALFVGPDGGCEPLMGVLTEYHCQVWRLDPEPAGATAVPDRPGLRPRPRQPYPHPYPRGREHLAGFPCTPLWPVRTARASWAKRALDATVSGLLLVLAGPLLVACAAVLRLVDGPGVVFRQERVGKDGRPFTLLKFRTYPPADAQEASTRWSIAGEQHMSRFCRFLRRTSLDELPQLWNVFRGDMSLVGPRPERPHFVAKFSRMHPGYAARHRMPTGITGLAQIHGLRGDTSIEDRCRFDNAYIDTWSFWQDICILVRTAIILVRPTGS